MNETIVQPVAMAPRQSAARILADQQIRQKAHRAAEEPHQTEARLQQDSHRRKKRHQLEDSARREDRLAKEAQQQKARRANLPGALAKAAARKSVQMTAECAQAVQMAALYAKAVQEQAVSVLGGELQAAFQHLSPASRFRLVDTAQGAVRLGSSFKLEAGRELPAGWPNWKAHLTHR